MGRLERALERPTFAISRTYAVYAVYADYSGELNPSPQFGIVKKINIGSEEFGMSEMPGTLIL